MYVTSVIMDVSQWLYQTMYTCITWRVDIRRSDSPNRKWTFQRFSLYLPPFISLFHFHTLNSTASLSIFFFDIFHFQDLSSSTFFFSLFIFSMFSFEISTFEILLFFQFPAYRCPCPELLCGWLPIDCNIKLNDKLFSIIILTVSLDDWKLQRWIIRQLLYLSKLRNHFSLIMFYAKKFLMRKKNHQKAKFRGISSSICTWIP